MKLVIDASNISSGGGLTHLIEFIKHAKPKEFGFEHAFLWASEITLNSLEEQEWLTKCHHSYLNKSYIHRFIWKYFILKPSLNDNDVLFIPGTGFLRSTAKVITMCRNLLPIDVREMNRFFPSFSWLRYRFLRIQHFEAFKKADGVIFLNTFCLNSLPHSISGKIKNYEVIPHGVNDCFKEYKKQSYSLSGNIRIVYISRLNLYKHQWTVAEAVFKLKEEGNPVELTLAGGMSGPGREKLNNVMTKYGETYKDTLIMKDLIPYHELPEFYNAADIFVFASSCETFGNILLEAMASGLPIACSDKSSMRELLQDAGVYFDPESVESIKDALKVLINDEELREKLGNKSYELSNNFSWEKSSRHTLKFMSDVNNL